MNKKLKKYFESGDAYYISGLVLIVLACLFIWLGVARYGLLFLPGLICFPAGIVLFVFGSMGRVESDAIDKIRDEKLLDFGREISEDAKIKKRFSAHIQPAEYVQYEYDESRPSARKDSAGVIRTTVVSAFKMYFLRDALLIASTSFSILDEDEREDKTLELMYADLKGAEIKTDDVALKMRGKKLSVKRATLNIFGKNGETVFSSQVPYDVVSDKLAETVNKAIKAGSVE